MKRQVIITLISIICFLAPFIRADAANLLTDSGFEYSIWPLTSGPWTDWSGGADGGAVGFQSPDQVCHFGNKSAGKSLCGTGTRWGGYSQSATVNEGDSITASGWMMSPSSGEYPPLSDGAAAFIKLEFFDNSNSLISSNESAPITSSSPWLQHFITMDAPAGAVKAVLSFVLTGSEGSAGSVFFDDAFIGINRTVIIPPIKIISPPNGAIIKSDVIPVVGTVADNSVTSIDLNGVTVPCWERKWESTVNLNPGANQITATVNGTDSDIVSVNYDTSAPLGLFEVIYPYEGAILHETPALVTAIIYNPSDLYLNINGKEYLSKEGILVARVPVRAGNSTLVIKCKTLLGQEETKSINVTFDTSDTETGGLIVNNSFEDSFDFQKDWIKWSGNVSHSYEDGSAPYPSTAYAHSGTQSAGQILYGHYPRWGGASQEFYVNPGDTINASAWAASFSSDNPLTGDAEAYLQITYNSNHNNLVESYKSNIVTGATDQWVELAVSSVAPYGAETATVSLVQVDLNGNTGTVFFDDARVEVTPGDPPAGPDLPFAKPQSTGLVKIDGNKILVDNVLFKIKGVTYQPIPIGSDITSSDIYSNPQIYNRDLPLLRAMGANAIRTYSSNVSTGFLDACYNGGVNPIYVIMGFYIDGARDLADPAIRESIKSEFINYVNTYKAHPAVLMWSPGNEVELAYPYQKGARDYYTLLNELAEAAYNAEKPAYHPVSAALANIYHIGDKGLLTTDGTMDYLDVWGANVYEGISFGDMFDDFAHRSSKPFWISEYGIDAYYSDSWLFNGTNYIVSSGHLDEEIQAEWDASMAAEIMSSDVASGGTLMSYADEWWKAGSPGSHDAGGVPQDARHSQDVLPDRFMNEEYWGVVSISPDGADADTLDDITPRQVFYKLKEIYGNMPFTLVRGGESIQAAVDDPASEPVIYVQKGIYDADPVIEIENNKTLLGVIDAEETVINGSVVFKESDGAMHNFTVLYPAGGYVEFQNAEYPAGLQIVNDAGITIINSNADVKNCIIRPDLENMDPQPARYGKGIQIWNLYGRSYISPNIRNNLITNAETGIFMFSQAFGGEIWGTIQNNTLDNNTYGIIERMHKENPIIQNNIITGSQDGVHITYQDASLLDVRLGNIIGNDFWGNVNNVWCDAAQSAVAPTGEGNISEDPQYFNVPYDYTPLNPTCLTKGFRLISGGLALTQSFENGLQEWVFDDDDETCPGGPRPPAYTQLFLVQNHGYDGINSVKIRIEGTWDDGTGWVERTVSLSPNTTYTVNMSFGIWSGFVTDNTMGYAAAYAGISNPEVEENFTRIGDLDLVAGWREYNYSTNITTDSSGAVFIGCGASCVWETEVIYYIDSISATFTPVE